MTSFRNVIPIALMGMAFSTGVIPPAAHADGGSVTGKVVFEGTPPPVREIQFGAEKQCALAHSQTPTYEDLVVNGNGTLKWAFVYVKDEVPGEFPIPTEPVVFDQKGCVFIPHVAAVRVGQPIEVRNDDPVLHNVRAQSKLGQSFNIAQPVQGMKTTKMMKKPEVGIPLKCDVHFWMTSYLHVLAHPCFGVTGDAGTVVIQHLPTGTYIIEAWHEKLGTQTQTLTIQDGEMKTVEFVFKGS